LHFSPRDTGIIGPGTHWGHIVVRRAPAYDGRVPELTRQKITFGEMRAAERSRSPDLLLGL
jgi:hypothetical protein